MTFIVFNICLVADVKFQENNYYGRPDSSDGIHAVLVKCAELLTDRNRTYTVRSEV